MSASAKPRLFVAALLALCVLTAGTALAASLDFAEPATSPEPAGFQPEAIAAADLDGDGDQDLAVANSRTDGVTLLRNNGSGHFAKFVWSPAHTGDEPVSVAAADLDGDGDQDLAVANTRSNNVTILRNQGAAKFTEPAWSPVAVGAFPRSVVAADLDGDADQDLAVANNGSHDVTILRYNGRGFGEVASSPEDAGQGPSDLAAADLDGDGDADLAVTNFDSGNVTILRNNGPGNFVEPGSSPESASDRPSSLAAADLDGDGDRDLAVTTPESDRLTILRNNGPADFSRFASSPEPAGRGPNSVIATNFDGDLDQDLAVVNNESDGVTILDNDGLADFTQPPSSPEAAHDGPGAVVAADLDGDLDQDLAVANRNSDDVTILLNQ